MSEVLVADCATATVHLRAPSSTAGATAPCGHVLGPVPASRQGDAARDVDCEPCRLAAGVDEVVCFARRDLAG